MFQELLTGLCMHILYVIDCYDGSPLSSLPLLTAGNDYMAGPYTVSFSAGLMYATLMVSTVDDNTTELSEYFRVVITSTSQPGVTGIGSPNMAFITIEDNNPGTVNLINPPLLYAPNPLITDIRAHEFICMALLLM